MRYIAGVDRAERRRFVRHYLEMVAAMVAGMAIGGALVSLLCSVTGHEDLLEHAGTSAPIMATNMTVGMTVWMRLRGHDWTAVGEMAGAMYLPLAVLIVPFGLGVVPGGLLLSGVHVLMLPAMWIAMLHRPEDYVHGHRPAAGQVVSTC